MKNFKKKDIQEKEKRVYLAWKKNTRRAEKLEEIASGSRASKAGRMTQSPNAFSPHPSFIFA